MNVLMFVMLLKTNLLKLGFSKLFKYCVWCLATFAIDLLVFNLNCTFMHNFFL